MSLAKKIFSTFFEMDDDKNTPGKSTGKTTPPVTASPSGTGGYFNTSGNDKFKDYFKKLFEEANMPGPDYFEFSKMIDAMKTVSDENQRYTAAFAGLSVQGLDKGKLLDSANGYIKILDNDAKNFNNTINTAVNDKVQSKKADLDAKTKKIADLSRDITDLNNQITLLSAEIKENEEKIKNSTSGYQAEFENTKQAIKNDIDKINKYL